MSPEEHDSRWTHAICIECWDMKHPMRRPTRVVEPDPVKCCFCGSHTDAGIWTRADPATTPCMKG